MSSRRSVAPASRALHRDPIATRGPASVGHGHTITFWVAAELRVWMGAVLAAGPLQRQRRCLRYARVVWHAIGLLLLVACDPRSSGSLEDRPAASRDEHGQIQVWPPAPR